MLVTKHACKLPENMDWIDQSLADVEDHLKVSTIDPFHIVISLRNCSSIEKSIKLFLKMKGQIAY